METRTAGLHRPVYEYDYDSYLKSKALEQGFVYVNVDNNIYIKDSVLLGGSTRTLQLELTLATYKKLWAFNLKELK